MITSEVAESFRRAELANGVVGRPVGTPSIRPAEIHKTDPSNVWIHHAVEESPHSMCANFRVPASRGVPRFVDLMEVQRQVGILQAHRQMGVPDTDVFVLDEIALKLVTNYGPSDISRHSGVVRAQLVATSSRGRSRSLSQYFALEGPGGLIAVGTAAASLVPHAVYDRVRSRPTAEEGTTSAGPRYTYMEPIRVSAEDPLLSDHPSDHLTAVQTIADVERVSLEQSSYARVRSLKLEFHRYADADPAPTLQLRVSKSGRLRAEVVQLGVRRAKITGTLEG